MTFALCGGALLGTCLYLRALADPRGAPSRFLFLWMLAYAQIVVVSEILSELHLLGAGGFLTGHALLLIASFAWWKRGGAPRLAAPAREAVAAAFLFVRRHRAVALFAAAVGLLGVVNLVFPFLYPVLNGDANSYHLPRAYYWTTLGTARHFPTADFRMNEMPPDPSFVFAWILALSGSFRGLHVPQWVAGVVLSMAVAGMARLAGAGRGGALLAGSLTATLPVAILQAGTAQTDLTAAAAGAAALFFGLRAAAFGEGGAGRRAGPDAIGFGIALGLALGTKLTVVFLLPGLVFAMVAVGWSRHRREAPWRLAGLAAFALGGFALLGAYNYVLNIIDVGNPIASKKGLELTLANRPSWCYEKAPSALKYLHQTLDWPGMARSQTGFFPSLQERTFEAAARGLGLKYEMGESRWAIRESRFAPDEDHSGFGPVGFVAFLLSPAVLVASAISWVRSRRPEPLVRSLLVVAALGWFVGFVFSGQPWIAEGIRYFLMFIPLLVAALVAQGSRTSWGTAAAFAAAGVSLITAFAVTSQGPGGIRKGAYRAPDFGVRASEEVIASLTKTLPTEFPDQARIGIVSEFNDVVFHLFRSVPRIHFVPVCEADVPALLRSGRIDGAVVGQFRNEAGQGWTRPGIPVPRNVVVVGDPRQFFTTHPRQYALDMGSRDGRAAARISVGREKRWEGGRLHLRLPVELAGALGGPLEVVLSVDRDLSAGDAIEAHCQGVRADVEVQGRALRVEIPQACLNPDLVLIDLVLDLGPKPGPISLRGDVWVLGGSATVLRAGEAARVPSGPEAHDQEWRQAARNPWAAPTGEAVERPHQDLHRSPKEAAPPAPAHLPKSETLTHWDERHRDTTGPSPRPEVPERGKKNVRHGMEAKRTDSVAVPEVDGEHAIRTIDEHLAAWPRDRQQLLEDRQPRRVLVRQCLNTIGVRQLLDADVLDHPGRDDALKETSRKRKPLRIGQNERRPWRMLLHPAREPVGIEVHADDPEGPPPPLRNGVAVSATHVEKQAARRTPALGHEASVVLDAFGRRRLLEGFRLDQQIAHALHDRLEAISARYHEQS